MTGFKPVDDKQIILENVGQGCLTFRRLTTETELSNVRP